MITALRIFYLFVIIMCIGVWSYWVISGMMYLSDKFYQWLAKDAGPEEE